MRPLFDNLIVLAFCLLASLIFVGSAHSKVYKWVDKDGKVHYSDKPQGKNATELDIKKDINKNSQREAQNRNQELIDWQKKRLQVQMETEKEQKAKAEKEAREKKAHETKCRLANSQLGTLKAQIRILTANEKGEQYFMSDEERKKEINMLETFIKQNC
ncbi:DUF4124 domain-containing protein [Aliikangiella sp. G2MR2-5]|uniref:DUF4124 domain-containing protein n=1 Tax=Aliikangiella sp. G2MR2-5 TaxID=2788943 RepID=UPI0018AA141C|nr:DUF4124 domain-containing protein [Aliikangiella sp. G2MR2-5]